MLDAYASQTRAHLNINMDAPLIIIPISSKNHVTFLADLGKLHFSNAFVKEHEGRIYDKIHFNLRDLQMHRVKIGKVQLLRFTYSNFRAKIFKMWILKESELWKRVTNFLKNGNSEKICEFWKITKNCEFLGKLLIWKKNSVF